MTMPQRPFGNPDLLFNPIGFGAMRIQPNDQGYSDALLYALEKGVDFIDTARNYGQSEEVVAKTLRQWTGERPFIATKVKPKDISNWRFYVPIEKQFTPDSIRESVETSLATLGVDCLDLVQLHQWYYPWSYRIEWLDTLRTLRDEGKLRYIGVSAQDHEHDAVLKLVEDGLVDSVQIILNAFESRPLVSCVPLCEQKQVGFIARCVFDHSGSLATGGDREVLANDVKLSNASPELVSEYLRRIARLRDDLCDDTMDLNELSIRFALTQPGVSILALSLSSAKRIDRALKAAEKGPLPADVFDRVCREHVWVKNFYYLSKSTVDGNPSK
ncbi:aldo/keto reductase [Algisphaera agarilytica]|uniref:Aryl-alcohol dehydrogenase-like predicted oxidoreductase n=1 Tax=Algisphaera agarilytica TaxID=1385975 RepID=A0A7X0H9E9_9BACT|nr:aldo/keto reductase [Algisphaera agarilytica]MBB6431705.1 aryl-alcohol dehydrogenase-like predicted oxidoreductase [Algisphaera agarilytica]